MHKLDELIAELDDEVSTILTENEALKASLKEMLIHYWGEGDSDDPPEFIKRAKALIGE